MTARDDLVRYAASTRTITADGLAPFLDSYENEILATIPAAGEITYTQERARDVRRQTRETLADFDASEATLEGTDYARFLGRTSEALRSLLDAQPADRYADRYGDIWETRAGNRLQHVQRTDPDETVTDGMCEPFAVIRRDFGPLTPLA